MLLPLIIPVPVVEGVQHPQHSYEEHFVVAEAISSQQPKTGDRGDDHTYRGEPGVVHDTRERCTWDEDGQDKCPAYPDDSKSNYEHQSRENKHKQLLSLVSLSIGRC